MTAELTADDLWPLVQKLPHDEQLRLAKLALRAVSLGDASDAKAYRAAPPAPDEFSREGEDLAWDAEGWDGLDAPR